VVIENIGGAAGGIGAQVLDRCFRTAATPLVAAATMKSPSTDGVPQRQVHRHDFNSLVDCVTAAARGGVSKVWRQGKSSSLSVVKSPGPVQLRSGRGQFVIWRHVSDPVGYDPLSSSRRGSADEIDLIGAMIDFVPCFQCAAAHPRGKRWSR
jgi:hypothetical protein